MDRVDIGLGNAETGKIIAAEMAPDQPERAERLPVVAQRCAALVVVEDPRLGIIGPADVIDDAVFGRRDPFGRAAAHQLGLWKQPREDHAREQLVGVKAAGMGDDIAGLHHGVLGSVRLEIVARARRAGKARLPYAD